MAKQSCNCCDWDCDEDTKRETRWGKDCDDFVYQEYVNSAFNDDDDDDNDCNCCIGGFSK